MGNPTNDHANSAKLEQQLFAQCLTEALCARCESLSYDYLSTRMEGILEDALRRMPVNQLCCVGPDGAHRRYNPATGKCDGEKCESNGLAFHRISIHWHPVQCGGESGSRRRANGDGPPPSAFGQGDRGGSSDWSPR
ncbi:MAG: hypothetical protein ACF8PN_15360 [Phycisphaerales bacterium]